MREDEPTDMIGTKRPSVLLLGMGWFPDQPGGLNRYLRNLFEALSQEGVRTSAVVVGPAHDRPEGVLAVADASHSVVRRVWQYARATAGTREVDLVDAHFALYAALPVLGHLRHVPLVVHFQGPWAAESRANQPSSRLKIRAKWLLERQIYRRAREVVVLSHAFKRELVEAYGVRPWRIHVVPPGVDLERFAPGDRMQSRAELAVPERAWVAVAARRLVQRTGIDVLLDAWAQLVPRENLLLLVLGDGPARADLETRAAHLGLGATVRFLGSVPDETLVACYRAADIAVVPSVALEGFGLVVLEAMACGTPVLATDAGGLPEALAGMDSGFVVSAGDVQGLAGRLQAAREGRIQLPSREMCRTHAERFSWRDVASRHRAIYSQALRPRRVDKLRVVYLDHCAELSGGEMALLRLLPGLTDVEPHVILAEDGPLVSRLLQAGISVEVVALPESVRELDRTRVRFGAVPVMSVLRTAYHSARLARRLRRLRPDLVHTNSLKSALYGGLAARLAGLPTVWHVRDRIAEDYLPVQAMRLVQAAGRRIPHAVIANSKATLATLGSFPEIKAVIPSPVLPHPVARDAHQTTRVLSHELRVGIVGRLAPWKGQDIFLRAFASAFREGGASARIIGAPLFGEQPYEESLRRLVSELDLDGRVEFRGFREDVNIELDQLDVLVHASTLPEPFGQVVVEGMAAGLPVLASSEGGPSETIDDGVTGLLYPPGDIEALARLLREVAASLDLRRRLGSSARKRAEAFFPEAIVPQVMDLYARVVRDGLDANATTEVRHGG